MLAQKEFLNFVFVGAPRSGSTWLAAALREHPEIWIPNHKELHFFNARLVYAFEYKYPHGIEHYRNYFRKAPNEAKLGELSPFYYYDPNAAYRIYSHFPNVHVIALLRNPVDVVYSLYLLMRQRERRAKSFEEEILYNPDLLDLGFYHRLLTPYFDWFQKKNIYIRIFEEFFEDEESSCEELFNFLGVDSTFKPSVLGSRINASTEKPPSVTAPVRGHIISLLNSKAFIPVKYLLHHFRVDRIGSHVTNATSKSIQQPAKAGLSPETRNKLLEQFEPDIRRLEVLLGRNLDIWRSGHSD
jgi:hypothetical protein